MTSDPRFPFLGVHFTRRIDGDLLDDFWIERSGNLVNVLSAPSPAATSAFAIAASVVDLLD